MSQIRCKLLPSMYHLYTENESKNVGEKRVAIPPIGEPCIQHWTAI